MPHPKSKPLGELDPADNPWFGTWQTWDDVRECWSHPGGNEQAKAAGRALCDAMIAWRDGGPPASPRVIGDALNSSNEEIRHTAAAALHRVLAATDRPFETLTDIWNNARAPGRAALAHFAGSISRGLSEAEELDFRTRGLQDRSKVVRRNAADAAGLSGLHAILPALKQAAAEEPDGRVREEADVSCSLLERGYHVFNDDDERGFVSVVLAYSESIMGGAYQLCYTSLRRAEVDRLGIDAAIEQKRQELEQESREVFDAFHEEHGRE